METLTLNTISIKEYTKYLNMSEPTIECGSTGIEFENETIYIYAYVDNKDLNLCDIGVIYNKINIEATQEMKAITKDFLVKFLESEYNQTA